MHPAHAYSTDTLGGATSSRSAENPAVPLAEALWDDESGGFAFRGQGAGRGAVRASPRRALGYAAVWRAVTLISRLVAVLPLRVIELDAGRKRPALAHPAYRLLHRRPNPWMTPFAFKQTLVAHALTRGNGYAYVVRDRDANPVELLPLSPALTYPVRENGRIWYLTAIPARDGIESTEYRKLPAEDVLHLKGLSDDGLAGIDVFLFLAETFGKAVATRDYGARFFRNSATPRIALEFPPGIEDAQAQRVVDRWSGMHAGIENAHKVGMLREGVKVHSYSASARDSQMIENIEFDAVDVANIFGLPPRKLGLDRSGGYNSLFEENQSIDDDTVNPVCVGVEQECNRKLLTEAQQEGETHYVRFTRNAVLQTNPAQRAAFYSSGIQTGWLSRDEVRDYEDLDPIPDGRGQDFLVPVNLAPAADDTGGDDPILLTKATE